AMAARALADGLHWRDLEEAFVGAAFTHYNDFGHSVIYVLKTGELVNELGSSVERAVLLPLVRHLCYTTREDLLPEFKNYGPTLAGLQTLGYPRVPVGGLGITFPATTVTALEWVCTNFGGHDPSRSMIDCSKRSR